MFLKSLKKSFKKSREIVACIANNKKDDYRMFIVLKIKIGNKQKILLPITDLYTIKMFCLNVHLGISCGNKVFHNFHIETCLFLLGHYMLKDVPLI